MFLSAVRTARQVTVADGGRSMLRYAVASTAGRIGPEPSKHAVYAGRYLLVVAGGIQNMASPGSASAIAVEELSRLDVLTDAAGLAGSLERGIEGLRDTFSRLLAGEPRWDGTGTVLTAMLWRDTRAAIAHIGSTRAYMLRGGELAQLTRDHTYGQFLVEAGSIRPGEMGSDPRHSSVIVRWLDGKPGEAADTFGHEAAPGDRYLLCTDGIDRVLSPRALRDLLRDTAGSIQDVADGVAAAAFPADQHGALTCIVADVAEQSR